MTRGAGLSSPLVRPLPASLPPVGPRASTAVRLVVALAASVAVAAVARVCGAPRSAPAASCPAADAACWIVSRYLVDTTAPYGSRGVTDVVLVHAPAPPGAVEQLRAVGSAAGAGDATLAAIRWAPANASPAGYPADLPFLAGRGAETVAGLGTQGNERRARWTFATREARDSVFDELCARTEAAGWRADGRGEMVWSNARSTRYTRARRTRTVFAAWASRRLGTTERDPVFTWWSVEVSDRDPPPAARPPHGTDLGALWAWPVAWDPEPRGAPAGR